MKSQRRRREGLGVMRLLLVLSSFAPLFILWAIKGMSLIPDVYFITSCVLLSLFPSVFLWLRICRARKQRDERELVLGVVDDRRQALLGYLFAMLLPFYRQDIAAWREFAAIFVALVFIIFLFWHLNLQYLNLIFAVFRYRIYSVAGPEDGHVRHDGGMWTLLTHRTSLVPGDRIVVRRITDTMYLDVEQLDDASEH